MSMPRLVLIVNSSRDDWLFAADTVFGKLLVVAGAAVSVGPFGDETL